MLKKFLFLTVIFSNLLFADAILNIPYGLDNMVSKKEYKITIGFTSYQEIQKQQENWVAIFKEGTLPTWKNVIAWSWLKNLHFDKKTQSYIFNISDLEDGKYEARFFYKDSYKIAKSKKFTVSKAKEKISANYDKNSDTIQIISSNFAKKPKAWIGIYEVNASNSLENVLAWAWQKDADIFHANEDLYEEYFKDLRLKNGTYEAKVFYNNSFNETVSTKFKINAQ